MRRKTLREEAMPMATIKRVYFTMRDPQGLKEIMQNFSIFQNLFKKTIFKREKQRSTYLELTS